MMQPMQRGWLQRLQWLLQEEERSVADSSEQELQERPSGGLLRADGAAARVHWI